MKHQNELTPGEALELIEPAVREAGEIGMRYAGGSARTYTKADTSPVTEADLAIDAFLAERLAHISPRIGFMSEEGRDQSTRLDKRQVFVVDPIDGTRGFIAASTEWVISVALVEDGRPIAGVLYRPTTGDLYRAGRGLGAYCNGEPISVSAGGLSSTVKVAGPSAAVAALASDIAGIVRQPYVASLALRLAQVAQGRWDALLIKPGAHDWDIAAAHVILSEAGGELTTATGHEVVYNRPAPRHGALVGASLQRHDGLVRLLARHQPAGL